MVRFAEWLTNKIKAKDQHDVDIHEIESIYDHAHIAVQLVRMYEDATNQDFLSNISTVANLGAGAYGVYNSAENQKLLPKNAEDRLIYWGAENRKKLNNLPKVTLKRYFPDIPERSIRESDTVRINVHRILNEFRGDVWGALLEIASTIIHECTHEIERETKGQTDERGPRSAEASFKRWAIPKRQMLTQRLGIA